MFIIHKTGDIILSEDEEFPGKFVIISKNYSVTYGRNYYCYPIDSVARKTYCEENKYRINNLMVLYAWIEDVDVFKISIL